MNINEINEILYEINKFFDIFSGAEITLEANPDDLTEEYVSDLKKHTQINRFSVGLQSFIDSDLKLMNRRHSAEEAENSIKILKKFGYSNISGDLIYGLPGMTGEKWLYNLNKFMNLNIHHLSAYHLSYEKDTIFDKYLKKGKIKQVGEGSSELFFRQLIEITQKENFIHYEISSFAKKGYFSQHNSSYWKQKTYLGLGPSAHSFSGESRTFNISNLQKYMNRVGEGLPFFETELLTKVNKYNEYIMTSLRTMWGVSLNYIVNNFGEKYEEYFLLNSLKFLSSGDLKKVEKKVFLTEKGIFISDSIISNLFYL